MPVFTAPALPAPAPSAHADALRCVGVRLLRRRPGGPEREILTGIDARFDAGRLSLLTGPTGTGKSTLLHLLGGLLRPTEGTIFDGDRPVSRWVAAHRDRWRREVGLALQSPHLLADMTALENVLLPLVPRGLSLSLARRRADQALAAVASEALAGAVVAALSGGERQRVALARALVVSPRWLLLDEPTSHQDAAHAAQIMVALGRARDAGAGVIVAAHDPRLLASPLVDASYRIEAGRLDADPPEPT